MASSKGHDEIVALLIAHDADVNKADTVSRVCRAGVWLGDLARLSRLHLCGTPRIRNRRKVESDTVRVFVERRPGACRVVGTASPCPRL